VSDGKPLVVVVSPYRIEYGPPQTLGHVARALADGGMQPFCVVPDGARLTEDVDDAGAEVRVLPGLATVPRTFNLGRLGSFLREHLETAHRIEELAREARADAIYSISEATFAGALAARRLGIPSIVHVIGMSIQSPRVGAHAYVRLLDRLTDQFIACSAAVAEMLARFGTPDGKITVVHNGVRTADILDTEGAPSPIDGPRPRIGMLAAYDPRKGHELFVQAAGIIARRFPEARFYLIGGALEGQPESAAFERQIAGLIAQLGLEERFERPGYIPRPDVYRWIRALDVMVVPSKTEAFAHALLEAMLCGVPVVATAIEGNLDAFVDGHSGVFAPSTAEGVADSVIELLEDPERRERITRAARERAGLFDLAVTLPALSDAVRRVIEKDRRFDESTAATGAAESPAFPAAG
jgi:glycosyltransferase involved in cell wall biosynthesis